MWIIEAKLNGEWVEICRTGNTREANTVYEDVGVRRGSDNVRMFREVA